jgi:hypothetical protein
MLRVFHLGAGCLALALFGAAEALAEPDFETEIRPLVAKYCYSCHNPDRAKGDLNLARFETRAMVVDSLAVWHRSVRRIRDMEMPPDHVEQPTAEERALLVAWIDGLKPEGPDCNQLASEESVNWYPGYVMSRRLNRFEYENTLRDLLGIDLRVAHILPADGAGGEGFDNNGNALFLSAIQAEKYLYVADLAMETLLPPRRFGGIFRGRANADARDRLLTAKPRRGVAPRDAAAQVLRDFLPRAWRRPVDDAEVDRLLTLFDRADERGDRYEDALKLPLKAALVSPHFLFLAEPEPAPEASSGPASAGQALADGLIGFVEAGVNSGILNAGFRAAYADRARASGVYPLGDYPLAARLAYFLWGSMPDEELFALAAAGQLNNDEELRRQVGRMLRDPRAAAFGELFATQWLGITQLGETTRPDAERFPEFDDALLASMRAEAATFFHRVVAEDRPLLELIDADYTFVDQRLAAHYGITGVEGPGMQRVQLADASRGGVLGMAAILTATSHPLRTSPVLRGTWVLEKILGDHVPPPPPNVGVLPEDDTPQDGLTLRDRLEAHRKNPDCASCHARIDPIGFGLENFDPIGRWRAEQHGLPIDTQGTLPSGETFNGPRELKAILMNRRDDIVRNLSRKMLGYALGRSLTQFDTCVVDHCMERLQGEGYRASVLMTEIVLSYPFRHRFASGSA